MSNPHKPFSTSWSAYEKQAASRGIGTGTALNQQYLNQNAAARPTAMSSYGNAGGASPTYAGPIGRGGASGFSEGIVSLGLVLLVILPVSITVYARTGSWIGAIVFWLVMVWAMNSILANAHAKRATKWVGRAVIASVAVHFLVAGEIVAGPFIAIDQAIMGIYGTIKSAYLQSEYVRTAVMFLTGNGP